ncbi:hypothetical protein WICPIJ_001887 [Wickerhamomyces pijperi]|uniref:Uncharacterized protein n=1 Tax=Wickerhamomyces pijperi TaxID=599730 RepID=A0A9P8QCN3_WICPI|nr:hypothetical protein WICPIJ_001887 [Wickerhamomyces pijperi]
MDISLSISAESSNDLVDLMEVIDMDFWEISDSVSSSTSLVNDSISSNPCKTVSSGVRIWENLPNLLDVLSFPVDPNRSASRNKPKPCVGSFCLTGVCCGNGKDGRSLSTGDNKAGDSGFSRAGSVVSSSSSSLFCFTEDLGGKENFLFSSLFKTTAFSLGFSISNSLSILSFSSTLPNPTWNWSKSSGRGILISSDLVLLCCGRLTGEGGADLAAEV